MVVSDYLALFRKNWLVVLCCLIVGAAVGLTTAVMTPPQFDATSRQFVAVRTEGTAGDLSQGTSYARTAMASWVATVPTAIVLDPVIEELDLDMTAAELAEKITASSPLNSQIVTITVRDESPTEAALLANAVADSFRDALSTQLEASPNADAPERVRVDTVTAARVPTEQATPNLRLNVLLGALLGLAVGVGFALIRHLLDTRIHTVKDLETAVGAPVLGGIFDDPDAAHRPFVVRDAPRDPRAEAYRRLRTSLQFLAVDSEKRSFVVTSAAPSEGKSTTSANIALTMAETGAKVVLVDADMRKPRVAELFALEGGVGLSDVLAHRVTLADALQPWGTSSLLILPAGFPPPNPAELLGSRAMADLIDDLHAVFDVVIIDAPPLLAVTDAAVAARLVNGAVMVAASNQSRKPQLESARKALDSADARLLGAVLTKVPTRGADSYGYGAYAYGAAPAPTT